MAGVGWCGLLLVRTQCHVDMMEWVSSVSEGSSLSLLSLGAMFRELFKTSQALRCLLLVGRAGGGVVHLFVVYGYEAPNTTPPKWRSTRFRHLIVQKLAKDCTRASRRDFPG